MENKKEDRRTYILDIPELDDASDDEFEESLNYIKNKFNSNFIDIDNLDLE